MNVLSEQFKALSHPTRLAILKALVRHERCCCHAIVETLPLAQSTVSQHLKILKKAGFVSLHIKGQHSWYCINHDVVKAFLLECNGFFGKLMVCSTGLCDHLEYPDHEKPEDVFNYGVGVGHD